MPAVPATPRPTVLRRLAHRLGRPAPPRALPPGPPPEDGPDTQRAALLAVLDAAVAEQARSDRAIAACGEPGPVPAELAQLLTRQSVRYARFAGWLRVLPADGELAGARDLAIRLVSYHQWMLHQSANLAFAAHRRPGSEAARRSINGLGAPADRLQRLRDGLRANDAA
ncbi:hypothetical protein KNE206_50290 [Kitasatospora sp. NE20-6]